MFKELFEIVNLIDDMSMFKQLFLKMKQWVEIYRIDTARGKVSLITGCSDSRTYIRGVNFTN